MRSFSTIVAAASVVAGVFAAPEANLANKLHGARAGKCLTDTSAQQVATNFANLIAAYSDDLADSSLTTDFTDYSSSVNTLIDSGCTGPVDVSDRFSTDR